MKLKTILCLMMAAGLASACNQNWTQDRTNFNLNLFTESTFGGSDCVLSAPNATFNKIRCCGATAAQVGGIITKANLPIVTKEFEVESNFTFIAASVGHVWTGLVNKVDAADPQSVNISSPKMLIGLVLERGAATSNLYCNGTLKANLAAVSGYSTDYVHVQRFKRTAGESIIYPEFWNGTVWITGAFGCDIYDVAGFDNSALAASWGFVDDATTKCADLNHMKSVSRFNTDYGGFFVVNNNSYGQENCVITNVADYWGGIYPYQYTTDAIGLTGTARLDYGCEYSDTYGYYSLIAVETECPGYNLKSDDILFYSKNESSLLAVINVGEPLITTTTTTITTTSTTLPSSFEIRDIYWQPSKTNPGGQFQVYVRTEKNGQKYTVDGCVYRLATIDGIERDFAMIDSIEINNTPSFAYTPSGGVYGYSHSMVSVDDPYWSKKSTSINFVNDSTAAGEYMIYVTCIDGAEDVVAYAPIEVLGAGATTVMQIGSIPANVPIFSSPPFIVEYRNSSSDLLTGAICTYTNNFGDVSILASTPQKRYQKYVYQDNKGFVNWNITCALAGYDNGTTGGSYTVTDQTCFDKIMNGNELGIDCGGNCAPCSGNGTGGGSCGIKYDPCDSDNDCCAPGWCVYNDIEERKICMHPSCMDGILNQGEFKVDCGGEYCDPCALCTYDSGCSTDGSQYCNENYTCSYQTCTTDADCRILQWDITGVGVVSKPTVCDTDAGVCRFPDRVISNNTNIQLGMDIAPVTGFTANNSGTIWYTLNCDNQNNGLIISTQANTTTYYSYALSGHSPAIPYDAFLRVFADGTKAAKKTGLLPELCQPVNGFGGMPQGVNSVYARVLFRTCQGQECTSKVIDIINYRHDIKTSLTSGVVALTADREYNFTVTNRSIFMQIRKSANDQYTNVTTSYVPFVKFNISTIDPDSKSLSMFFIRITTPYGEKYETKYGTAWWMPIKYSKEEGWGLNVIIRAWMIWILLAAAIIGAVYANYRLQARRQ